MTTVLLILFLSPDRTLETRMPDMRSCQARLAQLPGDTLAACSWRVDY